MQVQPLELLLEEEPPEEPPEEDELALHLKVSFEHIVLPGIQHVGAPSLQVGENDEFVQEAICPFGQRFSLVQLKHS